VPFTPAGDGHDTIPGFVNGRGPFAFILDTGADGSALYQWFAKKEHVQKGKVRDVDGQTGSVASPSYSLKTLSVDGHTTAFQIATTQEWKRVWPATILWMGRSSYSIFRAAPLRFDLSL
jgi:hypothetical protein